MNFLITNYFLKQAKKLKKKFPNLKSDLTQSLEAFQLKTNIHIGKSIYKIRINSQDLNKGKSSGLRSYIYLYSKKNLLIPLCIYSKSNKEFLSKPELEFHFTKTIQEISQFF